MDNQISSFPTRSLKKPDPILASLNLIKTKESSKLKKKLHKVNRENKNLNELIKQKNTEIDNLKQSSESLNQIINSIPIDNVHYGPTAANYKLIEISKKNRKLSIELLTTKSQLTKKELQMQKNQTDMQVLEQKFKRAEKQVSPKIQQRTNIGELKNHMTEMNQVIMGLRQENSELLFKLQEALKCLQQETGHLTWSIDEFISNPTNWHGRAEKIKNLQQEIEQYNEQLEGYKQLLNVRSPQNETIENRVTSFDEALIIQKLKKFEEQIDNLKDELKKEKSQSLSLKVRNEFLNEEVIKYMSLVSSMEQRTNFNNKHFSSLSEMIVQQQEEYDERVAQLNSQINNLKLQLDQANNHKYTLNSKLSIVQTMLSEKYSCIEKLLKTNKQLESDLKSYCGGFLFSCRDLRKEEFVAALAALETEKELILKRLKIMEDSVKETNLKNDALKEKIKKYQIEISQVKSQLEKALLKKGTHGKAIKAEHVDAIEKQASPEPQQCTEDNQNLHSLKVNLDIAMQTIDEQKKELKRLETEQIQQSKIFEEMVSKTKDTILETIKKFRTYQN